MDKVPEKPCNTCRNNYRDYANRERCHVFCDFTRNLPYGGKCERGYEPLKDAFDDEAEAMK